MGLLCSLHCTVSSVVYTHLVSVRGSACRYTEFSFIVQLGVIESKLDLASYEHGDAWICIQVFRRMQRVETAACSGGAELLLPVRSSC